MLLVLRETKPKAMNLVAARITSLSDVRFFFSRLAMSLLYNLKQFTIMCPDTQNVYKFTFILLLFYFIFSFKMKN